MNRKIHAETSHSRRRVVTQVKTALREVLIQLSLLNHQVGAQLELRDIDLGCLDLLARHGRLSPSALARRAGLHPATITGILDRLERGRWIVRERDPQDRRGVRIRLLRDRAPELLGLYADMNAAMDGVCDEYAEPELALLADFLHKTAAAGRGATDALAVTRGTPGLADHP